MRRNDLDNMEENVQQPVQQLKLKGRWVTQWG